MASARQFFADRQVVLVEKRLDDLSLDTDEYRPKVQGRKCSLLISARPLLIEHTCACDHAAATDGTYTTAVTESGRIAWSDSTGPPRVNDVHHPERLLDDKDGPG